MVVTLPPGDDCAGGCVSRADEEGAILGVSVTISTFEGCGDGICLHLDGVVRISSIMFFMKS